MSVSFLQTPFPNLCVVNHPLIQHKLTLLRDQTTSNKNFRELISEITLLLGYEATKSLLVAPKEVVTPLETCEGVELALPHILIVPILRAGLVMAESLLTLYPNADMGYIALSRNEVTFEAQEYYFKMPPPHAERQIFLCDPMLATGNSATAAISHLRMVGFENITLICIIAAPEGVKKLLAEYPDVPIFTTTLDRQLNEKCFILPGLGDAGDRLYGSC